jgi:glycosyltransferase involved in cell wall biosynthesis
MRAVALLSTYNEERFIAGCLEHLTRQGLEVYLIDNESTDGTVAIAERYVGRGLIGIERLPRDGVFRLRQQLARKEALAATLDADWFVHVDTDQIVLPPRSAQTLAQAMAEVEAQGYNAINFDQFAFVPTREAPDHDHPNYQQTMRWYYPQEEFYPHALRAWKRQDKPVELSWSGGHQVRFPGVRMYPAAFRYRHYLFLSVEHALRKYLHKRYDPAEIADGWHGWRIHLRPETIPLPSQAELRCYETDDTLDFSSPRRTHFVDDATIEKSTKEIDYLHHLAGVIKRQRAEIASLEAERASLEAERASLEAERAILQAAIREFRVSTSWHVTWPMRSLKRRWQRMFLR